MTGTDRFEGLRKLPARPVAEILAATGGGLDDAEGIDLSQPPAAVLAALDAAGNLTDQIRLIARSLPRREAIWWSCLAGRDLQPEGAAWATLKAAEDWVFKPDPESRQRAFDAANEADPAEESDLCARAAYFAEPEEDEPWIEPGLPPLMVELMNVKSMLSVDPMAIEPWGRHLIDRGLDIARGGNGTIDPPELPPPLPEDLPDLAEEDAPPATGAQKV